MLPFIRHAAPAGLDHFARTVRAAADTAADRKLSLTLRSIALSARRRTLPITNYSSELMKLVFEAAAEGSFVESIWRFHWFDNDLAAAILHSDCIGDQNLRLDIAIRSVCEDYKELDSSAGKNVLDALSTSASLCVVPPWNFVRHIGLIRCAEQLIESGPASTFSVALQLVQFIASDRACAKETPKK